MAAFTPRKMPPFFTASACQPRWASAFGSCAALGARRWPDLALLPSARFSGTQPSLSAQRPYCAAAAPDSTTLKCRPGARASFCRLSHDRHLRVADVSTNASRDVFILRNGLSSARSFGFRGFFPPPRSCCCACRSRGVLQASTAWWYAHNFDTVFLGFAGLASAFYFIPKLSAVRCTVIIRRRWLFGRSPSSAVGAAFPTALRFRPGSSAWPWWARC
jgi:hypothetical protein